MGFRRPRPRRACPPGRRDGRAVTARRDVWRGHNRRAPMAPAPARGREDGPGESEPGVRADPSRDGVGDQPRQVREGELGGEEPGERVRPGGGAQDLAGRCDDQRHADADHGPDDRRAGPCGRAGHEETAAVVVPTRTPPPVVMTVRAAARSSTRGSARAARSVPPPEAASIHATSDCEPPSSSRT